MIRMLAFSFVDGIVPFVGDWIRNRMRAYRESVVQAGSFPDC
jgi:hypothetical protein